MSRKNKRRLWLYQYPFPAFRKDVSNEVILAAHDAGIDYGYGLNVKKTSPEQFAESINEEFFPYSSYWVRFIDECSPRPLLAYQRIKDEDIQFHDSEEIKYLDEDAIFKIEVQYNEMALKAAREGHYDNIPFKQIRSQGIMAEILYEAVNIVIEE